NAADMAPLAQPSGLAGLAPLLIFVIYIADLADARFTFDKHPPHFAGRQPNLCILALFGHQLRAGPGAANKLAALAKRHLHGRDHSSDRDGPERQTVARLNISRIAGNDLVPYLETHGGNDISLLAIGIVDQ